MTDHAAGSGLIDTYEIGEGFGVTVRTWRLRLAGWHIPAHQRRRRRTRDRWHRRWQAEHTGTYDHLGATRGWTRMGAFLAMHRRIQQYEQAQR